MANARTEPSREAWRKHVAQWREDGQSVPDYCREHGLDVGAMRYRIRRAPASTPYRVARVERVTARSPLPAPPSASVGSALAAAVVIELGRARIHVESGVDPATLATVLAAFGVRP
jgi:hypothetical protein